jgi:SAM-dependent methyltransferase
MAKGAPLRWIENTYLRTYLHGKGVEIGGLWRKFKVPSSAKVWYLDRLSMDDLAKHYSEIQTNIVVAPDVVGDAEDLPLRDLDFIIASHVLEHLPSPLKALKSWYESLRSGGALLLKVPDKRFTFDHRRDRTPLQHLIEEYEDPSRIDERAHYAEWVEKVNGKRANSPEFEQELQSLMEQNYSIHHHVWIDRDMDEIIQYTRNAWQLDWKPVVFWNAHFYRKETVAILRKA